MSKRRRSSSKSKAKKTTKAKPTKIYTQMQCTPSCPYFPNMECNEGEWEYDPELPNVKRRKNKKPFVCLYDNHIIKSWYSKCPLKE